MRIGLDAMGGDGAPEVEVKGALAAIELLDKDDRIVLIGDEQRIHKHLDGAGDLSSRIDICHADQVIGMNEPPVEALRSKPNSSVAIMAEKHHIGELDAMISAGNTGACVAAAQMRLRRLKGVHRPGIAIVTPTYHGPVAVCDVGANLNSRPQHLYQYAIMASVYVHTMCGVKNPRVGLLSIGTEEAKGTELGKQTLQLLKDDSNVNFVGNVEGRDLFGGVCDVMVCDGFVGNVILKLMEGMAEGIMTGMATELMTAIPDQADHIRRAMGDLINKYDFNEYGGAPLLGVAGICFICHGASDHRAIKNAVVAAKDFSKQQVNERIVELLSSS